MGFATTGQHQNQLRRIKAGIMLTITKMEYATTGNIREQRKPTKAEIMLTTIKMVFATTGKIIIPVIAAAEVTDTAKETATDASTGMGGEMATGITGAGINKDKTENYVHESCYSFRYY